MADDLETASNRSRELGIPDRKLQDALKAAGLARDARKGGYGYDSKATIAKAKKAIS